MRNFNFFIAGLVFTFIASFVFSGQVVATTKTDEATTTPKKIATAPAPEFKMPFKSDADFQKALKKIKTSERQIAQATTDVPGIESQFAPDFITVRTELIGDGKEVKGVTNAQELDAVINKYSDAKVYKGLSRQAKFVAMQLQALRPYKSFIFRARRYVGNISATRTIIVSMLSAQVAGIQSFFPVAGDSSINHWQIVFDYITQPLPGMGNPIETDQALYAFLTHAAKDSSVIINEYYEFLNEGQPIWWDNKLFLSFAKFTSEKDRYVLLGKAEQDSLYSTLALNMSTLTATTAYSLEGFQASVQNIGQYFGIDGSPNGLMSAVSSMTDGMGLPGINSKERIRTLERTPGLFTIVSDGKERMRTAYKYLKASAQYAKMSYEETKGLTDGQQNLFSAQVANGLARPAGNALFGIETILTSGQVESAVINGDAIRVNLEAFYNDAPNSLSVLYPVAWDESDEFSPVTVWNGKKDKARNYKYHMATTWQAAPYQKLFPDIAVSKDRKTTNEVAKYASILTQTWGAAAFAIPLSAVIF